MITLVTADGAANGQAAVDSIPKLQDKVSPHMGAWQAGRQAGMIGFITLKTKCAIPDDMAGQQRF